MNSYPGRLRTPEERVGSLPNASLPPPAPSDRRGAHDELLIRALRDADERAFVLVSDLYFSAMLRVALSHVDSRATAEEVIQETWMAAIRGIHRFEHRSAVRTWLFRILRNQARTRGTRDSRMRPLSELQAAESDDPGAEPDQMIVGAGTASAHGHEAMWVSSTDPEQQLLARELAEHIDRALAALPPRQREVITLRDVEGWSAEDVCNALGLSQTNQRVILHRARDRVRHELQDYLADNNNGCDDDDELHVQ
jgi:RNA polymerase sigma-70 factor, ECF subfamily